MENVGDIGAGHTLGRYELLIPIASGGMASVWAARLTGTRGFQKVVAVKLMLAELVDDVHFEKMFLDEAELASRIKHPNVVEILDLGEQDGVLYQVMEWVDGEPLNQMIREFRDKGGVPVPLVLRIAAQACAGLHAAHELTDGDGKLVGLVHRDVSPQNLLVGYDGTVKVVDFGVAKAASNRQQTTIGQMKGKAAYMAPEQALGEKVDRRTDIFALGIVLFQLTTGKHPFRRDNDLATLRRIIDKTPAPRARSIAPTLPVAVEEIIAKALCKEPDGRFAAMNELMRALENALPLAQRIGTEEVGAFLKTQLGPRGEKRRAALKEALRVAEARSARDKDGADAAIGELPMPTLPATEPGTDPSRDVISPPGDMTPLAHPDVDADGAPASRPSVPQDSAPSSGALDLELLAQQAAAPRPDTSMITAVVVVCVLAAAAVGVYLWEASSRGGAPPPPSPTALP